ncbi:MAG: hypothetical protein ACR2PL_13855 [Dehalococcoidia bacterium]
MSKSRPETDAHDDRPLLERMLDDIRKTGYPTEILAARQLQHHAPIACFAPAGTIAGKTGLSCLLASLFVG